MGFKENFKSELIYSGIMVKELSLKTGIKKHTLDNYLNTHNALPNAETAVKIAQALGVSVEYLVTGNEGKPCKKKTPLPLEIRQIVEAAEKLSPENQRLVIKIIKVLKEQENNVIK
ncbi:MAG: helix-turn-helix domain containing protein [Treponema sp.]|nr:helix-turn-helix domain containing protein [Treponema sp.]